MSAKMKGYKVTNCERSKTFGIACKNVSELLKKASTKLQLKEKDCQLYLQDGTLVDDEEYFQTIPPQTCFVLISKGQQLLTGADIIYNALCAVNLSTLKTGLKAKEFFHENVEEKVKVLSKFIDSKPDKAAEDKSHLTSRLDHPEWFQGLDTGAKTKEQFMRRRCSERMRGYLYKADKDIKSHPLYSEIQFTAEQVISHLKLKLSSHNNMGHYFDRSHSEALCDSMGLFNCDGLWNKNRCESSNNHVINPYSSREERIIFSTWNLDHRIEKSREVIPSLISACRKSSQDPDKYQINIPYFFRLLFTADNLKLVHIVCHDKQAHCDAKCNPKLIFINKDETDNENIIRGVKRKLSQEVNTVTSVKV